MTGRVELLGRIAAHGTGNATHRSPAGHPPFIHPGEGRRQPCQRAAAEQHRLALLEETFEAAESLGIPVTAEGCESEADFDVVVDIRFQYAQGSFFGGPLDSEELVERVGAWRLPTVGPEE